MSKPRDVEFYKAIILECNEHYRAGIFEIIGYKNGKIITKDCFGKCAIKKDTLYKNGKPNIISAIDKTRYAIKQFENIHKKEYDYSKFKYTTSIKKSTVICQIHGEFEINHHNHCQGKRCKKCSLLTCSERSIGWGYTNWEKAGKTSNHFDSFKFYIMKCWDEKEHFYKIGKTFTKMNRRYTNNRFPYEYEVVLIIEDEDSRNISKLENDMKISNKKFKYIPLKTFGGRYECFTKIIDINNGKEIN